MKNAGHKRHFSLHEHPDAGFFDVPNKRENIGAIVVTVTAGAGAANTHTIRDTNACTQINAAAE